MFVAVDMAFAFIGRPESKGARNGRCQDAEANRHCRMEAPRPALESHYREKCRPLVSPLRKASSCNIIFVSGLISCLVFPYQPPPTTSPRTGCSSITPLFVRKHREDSSRSRLHRKRISFTTTHGPSGAGCIERRSRRCCISS